MKRLIQLLAGVSLLASSSLVSAGQLCGLSTSLGALPCVDDTGDEFFSVSDIDGVDDDITSFILDRNAGFSNAVGIYDPFNTSNSLELWSGSVAPGFPSGVVLNWDGTDTYSLEGGGGSLTLSNLLYASVFGMYLDTGQGNIYYSDSSLNSDGTDHLQTFLTEGLGGATTGFDITFAWEDLDLGDADFNDIVYGCIDCVAEGVTTTQVPIPGTVALMGLGLLGLRTARRKAQENW